MAGNRLAHPSPVPADRAPVNGHGLERDSQLRIIRDYVGVANPKGYIILYYRMVAVEIKLFVFVYSGAVPVLNRRFFHGCI
jgi:hypothetical protein